MTHVIERFDLSPTRNVLRELERFAKAFADLHSTDSVALERYHRARDERQRIDALYDDAEPGEVETFRKDHPPLYDQLDGCYDCGNKACPQRGFKGKEDKELHYRMWGLEPRKGL